MIFAGETDPCREDLPVLWLGLWTGEYEFLSLS